jgi:signal transduction histidine kinase
MALFSSLRTKLFILFSSLFLAIILLNFYLNVSNIKNRTYNYLESSNVTISKLLESTIREDLYTNKYDEIRNIVYSIENIYIKNIYILDPQGRIIIDKDSSQSSKKVFPFYEKLLHVADHQIANDHQYLTMKVFRLLDVTLGYMVIEANIAQYELDITKEINLMILYTILYGFLSIVSSFFISRSISRPLEEIITIMQRTQSNQRLNFERQPQKEYQYLTDAIKLKHNALQELNIHLEDEISIKTKELQVLNASLEERIEEAVNDLHKKEELLKQQSRHAQMGEMIAMIAHQWRQPLSAISATAFSIIIKSKRKKFDLSTPEAQSKHLLYLEKNLESIQEYVQFLSHTIDDFRNFFKPEKLKERCSINDVVDKALQIIQVPIQNHNIEITTELHSVQTLELFKNEMTQVVLNIMKNSEDNFLDKHVSGGEISLVTYDQDRSIVLEISDNGGGIKPAIIDKIFDPYFSTKEEKNGTGLGLYMSKVIVEEHNHGHLDVQNRDQGVCFIITFKL